jgi:hypothetical protein
LLWINHYIARGEKLWHARAEASYADALTLKGKDKDTWYGKCKWHPPAVTNQMPDRSAADKVAIRLSYMLRDAMRSRLNEAHVRLHIVHIIRHVLPTSCAGRQSATQCILALCKSSGLECAL